jgi:hypothetical protein
MSLSLILVCSEEINHFWCTLKVLFDFTQGQRSTEAMMEEYGNNASSSEHYVYREPVKAPINPPYKSALGSQAANPK